MYVKVECASEELFKEQYDEVVEALNNNNFDYEIVRDDVGFGDIKDYIIIGLVFVYESISSGVTFDIIKQTVLNTIKTVKPEKIKKIYVSVEDKSSDKIYDLNIEYDDQNIDIEIPGDLKLKITQN